VSNKNEIAIAEVSESSLAENKKKRVRHGVPACNLCLPAIANV
jgi:hypothetical protein